MTIDLGTVKDIGFLVDHVSTADRLAKQGYKALGEREVLNLVEGSIEEPVRSPRASQFVTCISIGSGAKWGLTTWRNDPRIAGLKSVTSSCSTRESTKKGVSLKTQLKGPTRMTEATEFVCARIAHKISEMFSVSEEDIDPAAPISRYDVDSLVV